MLPFLPPGKLEARMLIDMIHDNHGEPPFKTRYRDPAVLRRLGYDAIVIPDALTALPSARDDRAALPPAAETSRATPRKPADLEASIDQHVRAALAEEMQVFFYGDALLLPRTVVEKHAADFLCDDDSGRLCAGKPAVFAALQDQVQELFDRWPAAAGLVMRTGEVYPEATPHMIGAPLHAGACPTCRGLAPLERQARFIRAMHATVIEDLHKLYIHRAWQPSVPGVVPFHDDAAAYAELSRLVPASRDLIFSFKFTRGDFRHPAIFNPCLLADERPKWIEFQCEREYEGKGAFPNYQAPAWRAFFDHLRAAGVASPRDRFGLWGWSRGGGWRGPYAQREEWIDSNVHALAALYQNPAADPAEIASTWAANAFGIAESSPPAPALVELLLISAATIRRLLYVSALPANATTAPWVKDDLLDVEAIWQAATRVVEAGVAPQAIAEKHAALAGEGAEGGIDRMRQLFNIAQPDLPNKSQARDLDNTLTFYSSFAAALSKLFTGFVEFQTWSRNREETDLATSARRHLEAAQAQWLLHTQRHAMLPGAPSVFHETMFWGRTNGCLDGL